MGYGGPNYCFFGFGSAMAEHSGTDLGGVPLPAELIWESVPLADPILRMDSVGGMDWSHIIRGYPCHQENKLSSKSSSFCHQFEVISIRVITCVCSTKCLASGDL